MWGQYFVARSLCHDGRWADARPLLDDALRALESHPERQSEINCLALASRVALELGDPRRAAQLADRCVAAIEGARPTGFPSLGGYAVVCEVYRQLLDRRADPRSESQWRSVRRALWRFAIAS